MGKATKILTVFVSFCFLLLLFTAASAFAAEDNTKVLLGRGQRVYHIALKYTGNANNWMTIAKASGLKTDLKSQKRYFVGTILIIPQELLKSELRPSPSADDYNAMTIKANRYWYNEEVVPLQDKLADAQRELWYWKVVVGVLIIIFVLTVSAVIIPRSKLEKNWAVHYYNELKEEVDYYKNLSEMLPGRIKKFTTQKGKELEAIITKVEAVENVENNNFEITEVLCLNCPTRVHPKNFLSHHFQQHGK